MKERAASHHLARCPAKLGISALEKEVADLYLPLSTDEDDGHHTARDASAPSKPFASFGSFRQRHGDAYACNPTRTIEAPAKLESSACIRRGGLSQSLATEGNVCMHKLMAAPVDCPRASSRPSHSSLHRSLHKGKSCSTDLDREEAWERKKEQYLLEEEEDDCDDDEEYDADEGFYDALSEHASEDASSSESDSNGGEQHDKGTDKHIVRHDNLDDVGHVDEQQVLLNATRRPSRRMQSFKRKPFPRSSAKPLRTKSLTDEDLEELRGSIDLGFGFSYSERCNLTSTLPALELYYAINKNYVDAQFRSSPVSPLEGNALLRTNSAGSTSSPSNESWRISSPGDHPSQVKTRLRHWAQAVACSVKQGY